MEFAKNVEKIMTMLMIMNRHRKKRNISLQTTMDLIILMMQRLIKQ